MGKRWVPMRKVSQISGLLELIVKGFFRNEWAQDGECARGSATRCLNS